MTAILAFENSDIVFRMSMTELAAASSSANDGADMIWNNDW